MATFTGTTGIDRFIGGNGDDLFRFSAATFNDGDTISGNGQFPLSSGQDILQFTTAVIVPATRWQNVSGVDIVQLLLESDNNAITLTDSLVSSASGRTLIVGGSLGKDVIDASQVTSPGSHIEITSHSGDDTLIGSAGDDAFWITLADLNSKDSIAGGAGRDRMQVPVAGSAPAANLQHVTGIEEIFLAPGGNNLFALTNQMVSTAQGRMVSVIGNTGNDVLTASLVTDAANGVYLDGNGGNDTLIGGAGNDTFYFDVRELDQRDVVTGGAGRDTLIVQGGDITSLSGVRGVELVVMAGARHQLSLSDATVASLASRILTIQGGAGDEVIYGERIVDAANRLSVLGGAGLDQIFGGAGADQLEGGAGDDGLIGGGGADRLFGQDGNDLMNGQAGADIMLGGWGNDRFITDGTPGEMLNGGPGTDSILVHGVVDLSRVSVAEIERLELSADARLILTGAQMKLFSAMTSPVQPGTETLVVRLAAGDVLDLGRLAWTGFGPEDRLSVVGAAGNETIRGSAGTDRIDAAAGNDLLKADAVASHAAGDQIQGGAGRDVFEFQVGTAAAPVLLDGGTDSDTLVNVLGLAGDFDLSSTGDQARHAGAIVRNFENVDWSGAAGSLIVKGSLGANTLTGGAQADRIDGAAGNDVLAGGLGIDTLTGGLGNDTFVYGARGQGGDLLDFRNAAFNDDGFRFAASAFKVAGAFQDLVLARSASSSIAGADLVQLSGTTLADAAAFRAYLTANGTGSAQQGIFVVAQGSGGHTMLFYSADANGAAGDGELIADLGTSIAVGNVGLSDFVFV